MALFLTPRFAPTYTAQQCNPWACAPRPQRSYRRVVRPAYASLAPFFSNVDELISALDQDARREEAHRQRQQRKRIVRAHFNVHENQQGYQVDAEVPGFEQDHFEIEVTDDNTLKLSANTERKAEHKPQRTRASAETQMVEGKAQDEPMDGITLHEPEEAAATSGTATPMDSDTESHKSYQATVEDDFEDLGAETSSTVSAHTDSEALKEPKGKGKAIDDLVTTDPATVDQQKPQPEALAQQQEESEEWRFHGFFERTFRFPERIDAANVTASLRNGLLSITIPKAKAPETRRILIQ